MIVPHGYKIGPTGLESPAGVSNEILWKFEETHNFRFFPWLKIFSTKKIDNSLVIDILADVLLGYPQLEGLCKHSLSIFYFDNIWLSDKG